MQRRTMMLAGVGGIAGLIGLGWWHRNALAGGALQQIDSNQAQPTILPTNQCTLTPEQIEGPFFIPGPLRADIREDRQGIELALQINVARAGDCAAIEGARVEIWHCDAAGRYSAYPEGLGRNPFDTIAYLRRATGSGGHAPPENDKRYLRGAAHTNVAGQVTFTTIFPGWYEPRVAHIHAKVMIDERAYLTTQLYFPDAVAQQIYANHPLYAPFGECPYSLGRDSVLATSRPGRGLLLQPEGTAEDRMRAACTFWVA
ncbi:MAG: hypothetical protein AAF513_08415 [Pseudomonadota bacterium]